MDRTVRVASLTCVLIVADGELHAGTVASLSEKAARLSEFSEILLVANGVGAATAAALVELAAEVPDVTVQFLADPIERDLATLIGMNRAVGDWIVTMTPTEAEVACLGALLAATLGQEVVFATTPARRAPQAADAVGRLFFRLSGRLVGASLVWPTPALRAYSRAAVRWLISRVDGAVLMRSVAFRGAFPGRIVTMDALAEAPPPRRWGESLRKATRLLGGAGTLPLRVAIALAISGILAGLAAFAYVTVIFFTHPDVQPGWTTLSGLLAAMMIVFSALFALLTAYILAVYASIQPRNRVPIVREVRSARRRLGRSLDMMGNVAPPGFGAPPDLMPDIRPAEKAT